LSEWWTEYSDEGLSFPQKNIYPIYTEEEEWALRLSAHKVWACCMFNRLNVIAETNSQYTKLKDLMLLLFS